MSSGRAAGAVLVLIGTAIGLEATTFEVRFMTDPIGPKALPVVAALILVIAGVHSTLRPPADATWPGPRTLGKLAAAVAVLLVYPFALPSLGFFVSTALVVAALSRLYGAPLARGVAAATLLSLGLWLLFARVLALPIPIGTLWMR